MSTIDRNTRSVSAILERSKTSTEDDRGSQLAKLQAVVQMLGVLNSDLTTLAKLLYGKTKGEPVRLDVAALQPVGNFNVLRQGNVELTPRC